MKKLVKKHVESHQYALEGLTTIFKTQLNFKIEVVIAIIVYIMGIYFNLSVQEWFMITVAIGMVLITESFNTALEAVCDAITKDHDVNIKYAKDIAAGAVLLASITSVVIGVLVFWPYLVK